MTDRELLELAAKAAGIPIRFSDDGSCYHADMGGNDSFRYWNPWNPLTDDGDALRLAVRLRLWVQVNDRCAWAQQDGENVLGFSAASSMVMFAETDNDDNAATRRAIVRAAAEIGRGMNNLTPHDDYCDLFTASEFAAANKAGVILPYDGSGYWATESGFSYNHDCFGTKPDWATHVAWYNK